jgi:hypothetical protein
MGRSGAIQAAVNLEIPDGNIRYFDVKIEGMNGQLPNLDLFNLVIRICNQEGVDVTLHRNVSSVVRNFSSVSEIKHHCSSAYLRRNQKKRIMLNYDVFM